MMDNDLRKVKAGDYIWTIYDGWVKVTQVDPKLTYPILVETSAYSTDGMYHPLHKYPSAFVVPPSDFNIAPKPFSFKDEQQVLVGNYSNDRAHKRYFSHQCESDGKFYCYYGSGTKWSSDNVVESWKYCMPAEEEV